MPMHPTPYRPPGYRTAQERRKDADARRPSARARGYDRDWEKVRDAFLAQHRECVECGRIADTVDHIVSIADAPERRLDWSNLRAMCKPCHDSRTARDQGFARRGARRRPAAQG